MTILSKEDTDERRRFTTTHYKGYAYELALELDYLDTIEDLRAKVEELEEIVADIVVNEVKEGKGHTAECGVPYIPCNGKCGAVKEPEVVMRKKCITHRCTCIDCK